MILIQEKDRRNEVCYAKNSPLKKQNDSFFATDAKNGAERSNKQLKVMRGLSIRQIIRITGLTYREVYNA